MLDRAVPALWEGEAHDEYRGGFWHYDDRAAPRLPQPHLRPRTPYRAGVIRGGGGRGGAPRPQRSYRHGVLRRPRLLAGGRLRGYGRSVRPLRGRHRPPVRFSSPRSAGRLLYGVGVRGGRRAWPAAADLPGSGGFRLQAEEATAGGSPSATERVPPQAERLRADGGPGRLPGRARGRALPGTHRAGSDSERARTACRGTGAPGVDADVRATRPRAGANQLAHATGTAPATHRPRRPVVPRRSGAQQWRHHRGAAPLPSAARTLGRDGEVNSDCYGRGGGSTGDHRAT